MVVAMVLVLMVVLCITMGGVNGMELPKDTRFFFPESCAIADDGTCCPSYNDAVCGGSTRGLCRDPFSTVDATGATVKPYCDSLHNLSISWATDFYDQVCICEDNYWGAACEYCAPGWTGDDCSTALALNVRRNVQDITDEERATVVYAFTLTRTTPHPYWSNASIWEWAMALHYYAFLPFGESIDIDFAHNGPSLAHWHRVHQFYMERYLQLVLNDTTFTIPYWDWSNSSYSGGSEDIALQLLGGDGARDSLLPIQCHHDPYISGGGSEETPFCNCTLETGPFAGWPEFGSWGAPNTLSNGDVRTISRAFACVEQSRLPNATDVAGLLEITDYMTMASNLEHIHGVIHAWIGWTMCRGSPPSDPIFFLHHSFIDLIFERWIRTVEALGVLSLNNMAPVYTLRYGHGRDECASPFYPLIRNYEWFKPSYALGYTFTEFAAGDPAITTPYIVTEVILNATATTSSSSAVHTATATTTTSAATTSSSSATKSHKASATHQHTAAAAATTSHAIASSSSSSKTAHALKKHTSVKHKTTANVLQPQ